MILTERTRQLNHSGPPQSQEVVNSMIVKLLTFLCQQNEERRAEAGELKNDLITVAEVVASR